MRKTTVTLALAAALAVAAAQPAFAENAPSASDAGDFEKNNATTEVSAIPDASQLAATVPLKVGIVAPMVGGAFEAPSKESYKIENKSVFDIYVTDVEAKAKANWGLVGSDPSANGPSSASHGEVQALLNGLDLSRGKQSIPSAQAADWKVPAKADGINGSLGLALTGKNSQLKDVTADSAEAVMDIVFTIGPAIPEKSA